MTIVSLSSSTASTSSSSSVEIARAISSLTVAISKSKRAVFLIGAGVSTSAGIPDFRSKDTGLYTSTKPKQTTLRGPALFSSSVYSSKSTSSDHYTSLNTFHDLTSSASPTPTHEFFTLLHKRGQLRRVYSQNIDGMELKGGTYGRLTLAKEVSDTKGCYGNGKGKGKGKSRFDGQLVQLHGSLERVRCSGCDWEGPWGEEIEDAFAKGETLDCPACDERTQSRAIQQKRHIPCKTFLRPAIVLYDESAPDHLTSLIATLTSADLPVADCVVVMGTTLKIPGFKSLVKDFCKQVKARGGVSVFVNLEKATSEWDKVFDYQVVGKTDDFVGLIEKEWRKTRPRDWVTQSTLTFVSGASITKPHLTNTKNTTQGARKPFTPLPSTANLFPFSSPLSSLPPSPLASCSSTPPKRTSSFMSSSPSPELMLSSTPPTTLNRPSLSTEKKRKTIPYVLIESPHKRRKQSAVFVFES